MRPSGIKSLIIIKAGVLQDFVLKRRHANFAGIYAGSIIAIKGILRKAVVVYILCKHVENYLSII